MPSTWDFGHVLPLFDLRVGLSTAYIDYHMSWVSLENTSLHLYPIILIQRRSIVRSNDLSLFTILRSVNLSSTLLAIDYLLVCCLLWCHQPGAVLSYPNIFQVIRQNYHAINSLVKSTNPRQLHFTDHTFRFPRHSLNQSDHSPCFWFLSQCSPYFVLE